MITEIIQNEWYFFQQIHRVDGITKCMQEYRTFYIVHSALSTYLDRTLSLYRKMIIDYVHNNKNLTTLIFKNTATYYQYDYLDNIRCSL